MTTAIKALRRIAATLALVVLTACTAPARDPAAVPENISGTAQPPGFTDIRFWGDTRPENEQKLAAGFSRQIHRSGRANGSIDILALSGGGAEGAFGAGFLAGWSARGNRPEFDIVTGISTGALIAPFAFLGSDYDARLKALYTETSTFDLIDLAPFSALSGGPALTNTGPMQAIIAREMSASVIAAIAREHLSGRRLFIGTTNLDAQRPVIWDIGGIASSGNPGAAALIRKIILASASVPGGFPPVLIEVEAGGVRYQEMHVDGGVTREIFVYPPGLPMRRILADMGLAGSRKSFWLVHNAKLLPEYQSSGPGLIDITKRSIDTLFKSQGRADLRQIEDLARRDGFAFRLATIPQSFDVEAKLGFDPVYMIALYDAGFRQARSKKPWLTKLSALAPHR